MNDINANTIITNTINANENSFTAPKWYLHLKTINAHRRLVRKYCFKCGLYYQGLTHDLSKYSWTEFSVVLPGKQEP